jgi:hypothetical protein
MNPLHKSLLLIAALNFFTAHMKAQDLKDLFAIGHYRFRTGLEDVNGVLDSVEVDNAPIVQGVGIYSNGIFPGSDPENGANIRTPQLSTLYDDEFAVELEFAITNLDGETRPIGILGQNDKYLGFEVRSDNTFAFIYNKTQRLPVPGVTADLSTHGITIIHNSVTDHTEFYFGSTLVGTTDVPLVRSDGDGRITNVNSTTAQSYLGYWSNLFIYGSEDITAVRDHLLENAITLSPNPASESVKISAADVRVASWNICDAVGHVVLSGKFESEMQIDLRQLESGIYFLRLLDSNTRMMVGKKFVKD